MTALLRAIVQALQYANNPRSACKKYPIPHTDMLGFAGSEDRLRELIETMPGSPDGSLAARAKSLADVILFATQFAISLNEMFKTVERVNVVERIQVPVEVEVPVERIVYRTRTITRTVPEKRKPRIAKEKPEKVRVNRCESALL